jgi:MscS family membrane protein
MSALLLAWAVWAGGQSAAANALPKAGKEPPLSSKLLNPSGADWLTFGLNRVEFLDQTKPFDQPLWKYIASGIYILLAFYSSKAIDWLVSRRLRKWATRTKTAFDDLLQQLIHGPIKVVSFVIFLHVGLHIFSWPPWVEDYLSKGLQIVVAWSVTYMALKAVDVLLAYWRKRVGTEEDKAFDDQLFPLIRKCIKVFILIIAILATCQNLGLNITSVIASLSIGGLALGLAAQDTVANLFGGVAIFIDKPFRIGDQIKLENVDGVVETIGLRSTRVRDLEGCLVTIPNKTMGGATITNISRRSTIKTVMNFGVTYETPLEKVKRALAILEQLYKGHPMTHDVIVSFNAFTDSALNLQVIHWRKNTDYRAYVAGMQELNLAVMRQFAAEGINMAYPTQTLFLKQDSDWKLTGGAQCQPEPTTCPK